MRDPYVLLALVVAVLSGGLARSAQGDETKLTVEQVQELLSATGNLSGRDLRGMNLTGIDMSRADLRGAPADASQADLSQADLRGDDDLTEANLRGAELRETVMPLFPVELAATRSLFQETKNAMIFGWTPRGILVAKREAPNVHWGTTVTGPAWRLLRRQESVLMELTSRSANVLRELVG
jgi:hypothetical protein